MVRIETCLAIGLLLALPARCAELRPYRQLTGGTVHLSDLFADLGDTPDCELGAAPAPGAQFILRAPQLAAIARDFNVNWRPRSGEERSVLERGGITLPYGQILDVVRAALANAGAPADVDLSVAGFENPVLPAGSNPSVEAQGVVYDPAGGSFSAILNFTGSGMPPVSRGVSGRAYGMTEVAVLRHRLHPGAVITQADIARTKVHTVLLHGNEAVPPEAVVGLQLRHDMAQGTPITHTDVAKPRLVTRNGAVRIALASGGIVLGAEGIAIDEGGLGDHIRVQNPTSRAIIIAEITGENEVRAQPGSAPVQVAQQ